MTQPKEVEIHKVEVLRCGCGHKGCHVYQLSIGRFYNGSGFTKQEAEMIADALNTRTPVIPSVESIADIIEKTHVIKKVTDEYSGQIYYGTALVNKYEVAQAIHSLMEKGKT